MRTLETDLPVPPVSASTRPVKPAQCRRIRQRGIMWLAGVILAAGGSASIAQAGSASALAVEDFFRDARIRQVQLSPQGQRVALT
jgi:hypothetical protein